MLSGCKLAVDPLKSRCIIHVDMDAFYASVETRDHPELTGKPVIVGGLGGRGVVAAANYKARQFGVYSAMPMQRARRLCPEAVYLRPRMEEYRRTSQQIFEVFKRVTPLVEGLSLDEAFLDVTGSIQLLGAMPVIGQSLKSMISKETGLTASIGMAGNKFLAKLASDAEKPDGFVVVPNDRVQAFLDPMPIGRLWGIGRKTEPKLRRSGILTIGQLRTADQEAVRAVLGPRAGHFRALSRGEDERPVTPGREEKSVSQELTFETNVTEMRMVRAELLRQAETVSRRLRSKGLAARTVQIKLRDHRFVTETRSQTLRAPTNATKTVYEVARGLLCKWHDANHNVPLRLLGLSASLLEVVDFEVGGVDEALDQITKRFGRDSVTRGLALRQPPGDT